MNYKLLIQNAIELSIENVKHGGGPFGVVISKEGTKWNINLFHNPAPFYREKTDY